MPELPPVAFFSYAHADDDVERGMITGLHAHLCYELTDQGKPAFVRWLIHLFRRPFEIFIDREEVGWGQEWEERIDESLNGSTFFIAVLTPRYFERPRCLDELDVFLKRERQLGRNDLVLPTLFSDCPALADVDTRAEMDPRAARLAEVVAGRQWEDLRPFRRRPLHDAVWRMQIKELARKLRRAYARTRRVWWKRRAPWLFAVASLIVAVATVALTSASTPPPPASSITVASRWTDQEQAKFKDVIDAFEDRFGNQVSVEYVPTDEDAKAFVERGLDRDDLPDVMLIPSPGLLEDLVEEDHLQPIEEFVGDDFDRDYDEFWRELGTVNNALYGVWFKAAHKSMFWYNDDVFTRAAVDPPQTWEDLRDAAGTIADDVDSEVRPFAIGAEGDSDWVLTDWFENIYLRTAGEDRYDDLAAHEDIEWTDESVAETLGVLADVFGNDEWIAGGTQRAMSDSFELSVERAFGQPTEAAMLFEGDFVAGFIRDRTSKVLGEDIKVFPFPSIDGSERSVIVGGDMAVLLSDDPVARDLIGYLATAEAFEVWAEEGGALSPNRAVNPEVYPDDVTRDAAVDILNPEITRVFDMSDLAPHQFGGKPGEGMRQALMEFLEDPTDVEGTQRRLEAVASRVYPS